MKRITKILCAIIVCVFLFGLSNTWASAQEIQKVYLGGMPAGFTVDEKGAYVVGISDVVTDSGVYSPAKLGGLSVGDTILSIDGVEVNNSADVEELMTDGELKIIEYKHEGIEKISLIKPALDLSKHYRLGVFIRDKINGIGTITFINGKKLASLGHPILNNDNTITQISSGEIYPCDVTGYVTGVRGRPGELKGIFLRNTVIANVSYNSDTGVYGEITNNFDTSNLTEIELGKAKPGSATIFTTIEGSSPVEYSISIVKADYNTRDNKNFIIKITDDRLIDTTGGIVQGMSGSPIVQDGKLVGAVTHVFINDPTRGFGISIENMINN